MAPPRFRPTPKQHSVSDESHTELSAGISTTLEELKEWPIPQKQRTVLYRGDIATQNVSNTLSNMCVEANEFFKTGNYTIESCNIVPIDSEFATFDIWMIVAR